MNQAVVAEGLVKQFGETTALAGVSLSAREGTVLGLLGPNGAGKTTVVRILATLLPPDEGKVTIGGYDLATQPHQIRQLIGLTGQFASVDENLTGTENLLFIGRLLGMTRADARARGHELLSSFHLDDAADRAAKTYSGGMRRRLDLAASLVGRPRVLYLDEPTTGLDPRARVEVWDLIRSMVAGGVTVLLTTQYLDEADHLAEDIVVIDRGKVIATGTPAELKAKIGSQTLAVTVTDAVDVAAAVSVVAEMTHLTPDVDGLLISVPLADSAIMPAVVRRLDDAGVGMAELALRSASLNEVFLSLTGEAIEPTGEANEVTGRALKEGS